MGPEALRSGAWVHEFPPLGSVRCNPGVARGWKLFWRLEAVEESESKALSG